MITEKNDPKTMTKVISCDCKCKFSSKTCYSDQKWHDETRQSKCKNYRKCKKVIVGILADALVRIVKI